MDKFDYGAPAELFPLRNRKVPSKVKYRRFDTAADAIRFAVEELPEPLLLGAYIEIRSGSPPRRSASRRGTPRP